MSTQQSPPPQTSLVPALGTSKAPLELGERGVRLGTLDDLLRFATMIVSCGYAPKGDTPAAVAIKIQCGLEIGLPAMQALNYIAVVGNRPSIWGQGAQGKILSCGLLTKLVETFEGEGDNMKSVTKAWRKGFDEPFVGEFSVADAKAANLLGKDTYRAYLKDMLRWRSRSRCYDTGFSDVLGGLQIAEVARDAEIELPVPKAPEPRATTLDGLAATMTATEVVMSDRGPDRSQRVLMPDGTTVSVQALAQRMREAPAADELMAITNQARGDVFEAQTKMMDELIAEAPSAQPEDIEPPEGSDRWKASADLELETPIPVKLGLWESWCDLEVPKGSALYKACHAKGAPTWRTAAQGKKAGRRHALLLDVVTKALSMDGSTWEQTPSQNHQRAACALVMLLHGAAGTEEPKQEGALFP